MINLIKKFGYAIKGIAEAARGSSFQIQLLAAVAVIFLVFYFPLSAVERAILVFAIFFVLILETLNTIIERYADFISKDADPRVKVIKDLSAGAVLLSAFAAAIVGLIILFPYLWFIPL
ncbi:MAG: diacylglycerol kinase family protein [Patescibacteria group bacterium]